MTSYLEVDTRDLDRVAGELLATPEITQKALNSTLIKMAGWLKTRSIKGLSKALLMKQKIIRRRLKTFKLQKTANGSSVRVWYGLDSVGLIYLGAKQTARGVKAQGGRFIKSAFIARGKNGAPQVFKRLGKARLPLRAQKDEIQEKATRYLDTDTIHAGAFESQFFKVFEHELKWRMQTQ